MNASALAALREMIKEPEMRGVFFEAMNAGYAAENKPMKGSIAVLRGSKTTYHAQGPWEVNDVWFVTPLSTYSGGMTIISYKGVPVWMMQYFGKYEKTAISCLKAALRAAYSERKFFGGRGPEEFIHGKYVYENDLGASRDFQDFSGRESVRDETGEIGWHAYQGGTMF